MNTNWILDGDANEFISFQNFDWYRICIVLWVSLNIVKEFLRALVLSSGGSLASRSCSSLHLPWHFTPTILFWILPGVLSESRHELLWCYFPNHIKLSIFPSILHQFCCSVGSSDFSRIALRISSEISRIAFQIYQESLFDSFRSSSLISSQVDLQFPLESLIRFIWSCSSDSLANAVEIYLRESFKAALVIPSFP